MLPHSKRKFGRRPQQPDDRDWAMKPYMAEITTPLPSRHLFHRGQTLDQGETPECVAYGWVDLLTCGPIANPLSKDPLPQKVYDLAQQLDEWPGPPPAYEGTSVRGGAKAMKQLGCITGYAFPRTIDEITSCILSGRSPVVVGTTWQDTMTNPTTFHSHRFMTVVDGAPSEGGHCWLLYGCDMNQQCPDGSTGALLMQNSWSVDWAYHGTAWISIGDMDKLLKGVDDSGPAEACVPVERRIK